MSPSGYRLAQNPACNHFRTCVEKAIESRRRIAVERNSDSPTILIQRRPKIQVVRLITFVGDCDRISSLGRDSPEAMPVIVGGLHLPARARVHSAVVSVANTTAPWPRN